MKGFVLSGFFDFLQEEFGEHLVFDLMDKYEMPVGRVYSPMTDYPDSCLFELIEIAAELLDMPFSKLSKILGVNIFTELVSINQLWVAQSKNTFELLKSHDVMLNKAVESAFPGFIAPSLNCFEVNQDMLEISYNSPFLPAEVAEGIISAAFIYYRENFSIESIKYHPPVDFNQRFTLRRRSAGQVDML